MEATNLQRIYPGLKEGVNSEPPTGNFKIISIYRNIDGKVVVVFDDIPEGEST